MCPNGMKVTNQLPIHSRELSVKELVGETYRGHYSDEELHCILQKLIDSRYRLIVELYLTAWAETYTPNASEKTDPALAS